MRKVLDISKRILHKKNDENEIRLMEIIDRTFDGFFQVPNLLIDRYAKVLGVMTLVVYISMKRHAGAKKKCWPSVRLMAFELGMSSKSVIRGIADLEKRMMIKVDRKHRDHNTYEILNPRKWKKLRTERYGVGRVRPATIDERRRFNEIS